MAWCGRKTQPFLENISIGDEGTLKDEAEGQLGCNGERKMDQLLDKFEGANATAYEKAEHETVKERKEKMKFSVEGNLRQPQNFTEETEEKAAAMKSLDPRESSGINKNVECCNPKMTRHLSEKQKVEKSAGNSGKSEIGRKKKTKQGSRFWTRAKKPGKQTLSSDENATAQDRSELDSRGDFSLSVSNSNDTSYDDSKAKKDVKEKMGKDVAPVKEETVTKVSPILKQLEEAEMNTPTDCSFSYYISAPMEVEDELLSMDHQNRGGVFASDKRLTSIYRKTGCQVSIQRTKKTVRGMSNCLKVDIHGPSESGITAALATIRYLIPLLICYAIFIEKLPNSNSSTFPHDDLFFNQNGSYMLHSNLRSTWGRTTGKWNIP